jgi:hypothetical protein
MLPCENPAGRGDGIVWPECPHPFAGAKPRKPAQAENVGRPPSEIEREPRPFVEEPAGVIHGPEPFGLGYMPRLSRLEGRPCVGVGWRHPAKLNRNGRALGHVECVRQFACYTGCYTTEMRRFPFIVFKV